MIWIKHKTSDLRYCEFSNNITLVVTKIVGKERDKKWDRWMAYVMDNGQLVYSFVGKGVTSVKADALISAKAYNDGRHKCCQKHGVYTTSVCQFCDDNFNFESPEEMNGPPTGQRDCIIDTDCCPKCKNEECECDEEEITKTVVYKTREKRVKDPNKLTTKELSIALWFIGKMKDTDRAEKVFEAALLAQRSLDK